MKASVTDRQVFFVLFLTLTAYTVISIPKVIAQKTGSGGWTTILFTSLVFAAFAWVIVRLNSAFPGKMLFDYSRRIVGKAAAYVLAAYFALYFLLVAVHLNMQLTAVLRAEFYPKTPQWVMLVATLLVIGSVAYRGVTNVGRFFEVIGSVFVPMLGFLAADFFLGRRRRPATGGKADLDGWDVSRRAPSRWRA